MKNYKVLSGMVLKYIAIIAMTIDHTAFLFVTPDTPLYIIMRTIGRLTAPLMCFFLAEGFHYTKNRSRYLFRLAVFALISQPFYFMMIFRRPPENAVEFLTNWNVLFTFCLSFLVLQISENPKLSIPVKGLLIAACLAFAEFGDWSYFLPVWVLLFHKCRDHPKARTILFICVSIFMVLERFAADAESLIDFSFQFGVLLAPLLIGMYNGTSGTSKFKKLNRWVFYIYYPVHMAVLVIGLMQYQ